MLIPVLEVINRVVELHKNGEESELKYLLLNLHDTNVSNFLRFLGYWDSYGYEKFVRFSSSVRLELIAKYSKQGTNYYIEAIYDNERIKLPFCESSRCSLEELNEYFNKNLLTDKEFIESYCEGGLGSEYTNELKYQANPTK